MIKDFEHTSPLLVMQRLHVSLWRFGEAKREIDTMDRRVCYTFCVILGYIYIFLQNFDWHVLNVSPATDQQPVQGVALWQLG